MPGSFDPYHRWLGIPPEEQPADYYRLLGLARFESDPEVIRDAADRQMAHVRGYGLGPQAELSQRVLNELAGARACLFDAKRKEAYDRKLRAKLAAPRPKPPTLPKHPAEGPESAAAPAAQAASAAQPARPVPKAEIPRAVAVAIPVVERPRVPPAGQKMLWIYGGAAVACLLLLLVVVVGVLSRGGNQVAPGTAAAPKAAEVPRPPVPVSRETKETETTRPLTARAPVLAKIDDQTVEEGKELRFTALVKDYGTSGGRLRFSLGPGAPARASINEGTGEFRWTPTKEQAGTDYQIAVQVVAEGSSNLGDQVSFRVNVPKGDVSPVAKAPAIEPIPAQTVRAGSRSTFAVRATDPNDPPNALAFSLVRAPSWVQMDETSGTVTCTPPSEEAGRDYPVIVRVTSNGPGSLSAEMPLRIAVAGAAAATGETYAFRFPSGNSFESGRVKEIERVCMEQAYALAVKSLAPDSIMSLVVVPRSQVDHSIAALCSHSQRRPDGVAIAFCPGRDPSTLFTNYMGRMEPSATPASPFSPPQAERGVPGPLNQQSRPPVSPQGTSVPRTYSHTRPRSTTPTPEDLTAIWPDVRVAMYAEYERGKWDGLVASWNEKGEKEFWCYYNRHARNGLCCLFEGDRPRGILECDLGRIKAVHVILGNEVARTFDGPEQAAGDVAARALLKDIDRVEKELNSRQSSMQDYVEYKVNLWIGSLNKAKRAEATKRIAERARENQSALSAIKSKTAIGR